MTKRTQKFHQHLEWRVIFLKSVVLSLIIMSPCNCSATRLEKIPQLKTEVMKESQCTAISKTHYQELMDRFSLYFDFDTERYKID